MTLNKKCNFGKDKLRIMSKQLKTRILLKHDFEKNWILAGNATNPFVPKAGEMIIYDAETAAEDYEGTGRTCPEIFTRLKVGDGVTNVNNLRFMSEVDELQVKQLVKDVFGYESN